MHSTVDSFTKQILMPLPFAAFIAWSDIFCKNTTVLEIQFNVLFSYFCLIDISSYFTWSTSPVLYNRVLPSSFICQSNAHVMPFYHYHLYLADYYRFLSHSLVPVLSKRLLYLFGQNTIIKYYVLGWHTITLFCLTN